jgi:glycosyltransferase involved in cell wall biosynthesis
MKIALVVPGGVDRSGTHRIIPALLALISRLASEHELHVYALQQESQPGVWELCGARIHNVGAGSTRWRALMAIRAQHREAPFALIQSFFSGTPGLIAVAAARLLGIPSAVHVAGGEMVALPDIGYGGRLSWRGRARESLVLRAASVVTAPSEPMVAALAGLGIKAQRVPLGVDRQVWPCRLPVPRQPGECARLLHVGSLNRVKDQHTLLRAFALLRGSGADVRLDIVGEDTLEGEIQAEASALQVAGRIVFHGFLTQTGLRPLMEAAHVLVVSSRHEAGPIVALEAAVAGVPTVGTAVGHILEWAPAAALAAPVGNAAELAGLIEALLSDEGRRLRVAAEGQRRAMREDADHTAGRFDELYAALRRA